MRAFIDLQEENVVGNDTKRSLSFGQPLCSEWHGRLACTHRNGAVQLQNQPDVSNLAESEEGHTAVEAA